MLKWIHDEWLHLRAHLALRRLSPYARQAVLNASPQTIQKIDAILESRRERSSR